MATDTPIFAGVANPMPKVASPGNDSLIQATAEELHSQIDRLFDAFDKVTSQISPVLTPSESSDTAGPSPRAPRSSLYNRLSDAVMRTEVLRQQIYSVSDRIEL
jgi:hypothetical protein